MLKRFVSMFVTLAVCACAPVPPEHRGQADSSPGTAGDPGGGEFGKSTKDQVISAINDSLEMFKNGTFTNQDHIFRSIRTLAENFIISTSDEVRPISIELGDMKREEMIRIISQSKIFYDMKNCPGNVGHKHAAVSEHKVGANLCFNVNLLTRYPLNQLNRELLALLVHEFIHLLGHREDKAKGMQDLVIKSWPKLEFFQHFDMQQRQVDAYGEAVSGLNSAGHAFKAEDITQARKFVLMALSTLQEVIRNSNQMMSGFLVRVGNRETLKAALDESYMVREKLNERMNDPNFVLTLDFLNTEFCQWAEIFQRFRLSMYSLEDMKKHMQIGIEKLPQELRLRGEKLAFSCAKIPDEHFEFLPSMDYRFVGGEPNAQ